MASDLALAILLSVQDKASGIISTFASRFSGALKSINPGLQFAAGTALAFTGIVAGLGIASIKMASDYQAALNQVQALTGSSQQQMDQYDAGLKQLAMDAGVGPTKLAQGLYYVISAGYQGADAMKILTLSTQDSVIAQTDAQITAKAFTTVMQTFSKSIKDATAVNGEMLQTVTLGKMDMADYSNAISKVGQTSRLYHQSLETTNAVLATLTSSGYKSATIAATDYGQLLTAMEGKTDLLAKRIHSLGLKFDESKFKGMSFQDQLAYLNQVMQGHSDKLQFVLNGSTKAATAFGALTSHSQMLAKNIKQLSNQQTNANATQNAWAITQSGFRQSMNRLGATLQVVGIDIGQYLLPALSNLIGWIANGISSFATWVAHSQILHTILQSLGNMFGTLGQWIGKATDFLQHNAAAMTALKIIGIMIAGAVLGLLIAGFVALAMAAGSAALAVLAATWPFLLIGAAIAGVIAIFVLAWQRLKPFRDLMQQIGAFLKAIFLPIWQELQNEWNTQILPALKQLWQALQPLLPILKFIGLIVGGLIVGAFLILAKILGFVISLLLPVLGGIVQFFTGVVQFIGGILKFLYDLITGNWKDLGKDLGQIWQGIQNMFGGIWNALTGILGKVWDKIKGAALAVWNGLVSFFKGIWNSIVNSVKQAINKVVGWFSWLYNHNYYFKALVDNIRKIITAIAKWLHDKWEEIVQNVTSKWNAIKNFISGIWQKISGIISGAWNTYIVQPLNNIWKNIQNFFSGWPKQALQWGINLIMGFIDGIKSKLNDFKNMLGNIGQNIKNFLGFHSPTKEGPGRESNMWAPNLIKMFASGLAAGQPHIQAALNTMISPLARVMHSSTTTVTPLHGAAWAAPAGGHTFNITINGLIGSNKKEVVDFLDKELSKRLQRSTNLVTQRSGGRSS
jgi:TP901 family phage tail tape measure protein